MKGSLRDVDDDGISFTDLSDKELLRIPASVCNAGHLVHTLKLSRNQHIQLSEDLRKFKNLRRLALEGCSLSAVPDGLCDLVQLKDLLLSGNKELRSLDPALANLCQLVTLDVSLCSLTSIPNWLGKFQKLAVLDLHGNEELRCLNQTLAHLSCLTILNVSACSLASIPDWVGNFQLLEHLLLAGNKGLRSLNGALVRLSRLKKLDIRRCSLTSIPDWLGKLQMLEELLLSGNEELRSLNPTIAQLTCLKILDISSCSLNFVPDWLGDLQMLEELQMSGNREIKILNENLTHLSRLKYLDMSWCSLTSIPDSLGDLTMLKHLDLSNNQLEDYPECTLRLKSLQFLNLEDSTPASERLAVTKHQPESGNILQTVTKLVWSMFTSESHDVQPLVGDASSDPITGNRIRVLPVALAYTSLLSLQLGGNPITEPPKEIWEQGVNAIKSYMRAIIPGKQIMFADTINMIGESCAGKTSLSRSLARGAPDPVSEDDRTRVMQQHKFRSDRTAGLSVNINDFGGHSIYHSVIPIFLPCDGLTILVFNMFDDINIQEVAIKKWMLTVLSKSKNVRLVLAGTRSDKLLSEQRICLEDRVNQFSLKVLQKAVEEVKAYKNRLQCAPRDAAMENSLEDICTLLRKLEQVRISVVTLSCTVADPGLAALRSLVLQTLRRPRYLPIQWCRVINDIFKARPNGLHLTWEEVTAIAKTHLKNDEVNSSIDVILRYLVTTSQIFWLEDHPELKSIIFHSPQRLIDVCKRVLDHDQALQEAAEWAQFYGEGIEQYKRGILQESLLRRLLEGTDSRVIANFLQHFNIMSGIASDCHGRRFIIPSNLSPKVPSSLQDFENEVEHCTNSISLRLSFCGTIIPMAFFETSIATMLNSLDKQGLVADVWRDGIIVYHDGVKFLAIRTEGVITLTAVSAPERPSPWSILHPVVRALNDNTIATWHGLPPDCVILCSACKWKRQKNGGHSQVGEIESTLKALAADTRTERPRPTCPVCKCSLPQCLCYPTPRGPFTKEQQSEIDALFNEFRCRRESRATDKKMLAESQSVRACTDAELIKRFRLRAHHISEHLTKEGAVKIARTLEPKGMLIKAEVEEVCSKGTATEAAHSLTDFVTKKSSVDAYRAFLDVLENELHQGYLVD